MLLASGSAINVDVDLTFVVQLVLFVGLTLILKPVLFDPMLKLFEERARSGSTAQKMQARHIDEKSATALATYEAEMTKARNVANVERDKIRAEGVKREQEILAAVRTATTKAVDDGKRAVHEEAAKVRATSGRRP